MTLEKEYLYDMIKEWSFFGERSLDLTGSLSVLALGSDLGRNIDINESSGVADWVYTS